MGWLNGRVAVVTGASKGIGRALSTAFANEGASVVCAARSEALLNQIVALIHEAGGRATAVAADLSTEEGARLVVERGLEAFGHVDCLVNNAGDSGPTKPVQEYPLEEWRYTIDSDRVIAGQADARGTTPEAIRKSFLERSPLRRMATADDIAYAAVFLCSDHARSISGQCLPVNAGEPAS